MRFFRSLYEKIVPLGIPLAWLQLTSERKRFYAALAGITFAVAMMLFQMGLKAALFRQVVAPIELLNADLVMVGQNYEYFGVGHGFAEVRLYQALALNELDYATPLKLGNMSFKNVDTGLENDIFVIAFDPSQKVFTTADINAETDMLKMKDSVLFDKLSRVQYGEVVKAVENAAAFIKTPDKSNGFVKTELGRKRINIEGLVEIGATFAADGNVLMSLSTFNDMWRNIPPTVVNVGIIKLKDGANKSQADIEKAAAKLRQILPNDVKVMTKPEFIENEKDYWAKRTPIGFVITASMAVAIFVGAIIVYQILYTDVTDHLPEYATLKAIGFDDNFFTSIIIQESAILSILGFVPGSIISAILYYVTREVASMPAYLTITNLAIVFFLTLGMCTIAGMLATRKLRAANPADIF